MLGEHPDALRADFQQYYGLDIDGMGRSFSTLHAAALLTGLPAGARTWAAYSEDGSGGWSRDQVLLGVIADAVNLVAWSKTKDAQHNRNKPRSVLPNSHRDRKVVGMAMTADELMETINRIRGEVADG